MYLTKEKFEQIKDNYPLLLLIEEDVVSALHFACDLLDEEAKALEEKEPSAREAIKELRAAAYELWELSCDVDWGNFYFDESDS